MNPQNKVEQPEEDEDDVISQIKMIGSELFTSFSENEDDDIRFQELNQLDLSANRMFLQSNKNLRDGQKNYSNTERNYRSSHQCDQTKMMKIMNDPVKVKKIQQVSKGQKNDQNCENEHKKKQSSNKDCAPQNFKKKIIEKKKQTAQKKETKDIDKQLVDRPVQIQIPTLVQSRYLESIGNFKESLIKDIYKKMVTQQHQYQEMMERNKSNISLNELYKQKVPLYERSVKDKLKKKMKMQESRVLAQEKQLQQFIGTPTINRNIQIKECFEQRVCQQKKKRQVNLQKILFSTMQGSTFVPKTTSPKRFKHIESKVKQIWDRSRLQSGNNNEKSQKRYERQSSEIDNLEQGRIDKLLGIDSLNVRQKNSLFSIQLKNLSVLSDILEIEDTKQE